eukprot:8677388-Alexandrium_andersonii.AAC.1
MSASRASTSSPASSRRPRRRPTRPSCAEPWPALLEHQRGAPRLGGCALRRLWPRPSGSPSGGGGSASRGD